MATPKPCIISSAPIPMQCNPTTCSFAPCVTIFMTVGGFSSKGMSKTPYQRLANLLL